MIELTQEQQRVVREILSRIIPGRRVLVVGSRITGTAKPYSDLDLAIMGDNPITVRTLRRLRDAFDDSGLPFQVDLVDWAATGEDFRKIIMQSAVEWGKI